LRPRRQVVEIEIGDEPGISELELAGSHRVAFPGDEIRNDNKFGRLIIVCLEDGPVV
jgi:hypothetical protein